MKLDGRWASFDLEMFCQHCDQYLTSRTRVERKGLDAALAHLREEAQAHANAVGREAEVTYYATLQSRAFIYPRPDA